MQENTEESIEDTEEPVEDTEDAVEETAEEPQDEDAGGEEEEKDAEEVAEREGDDPYAVIDSTETEESTPKKEAVSKDKVKKLVAKVKGK